jgi:hypothetical protein
MPADAKVVLKWGTLLVGALSLYLLLWHFQRAIGRFRKRLGQIYTTDYFADGEVDKLGLDATTKHDEVVWVLAAVVVVASGFTWWII